MSQLKIATVSGFLSLAMAACGTSAMPVDGSTGDTGTGASDGGGGTHTWPANLPALGSSATMGAANFGCRGMRPAPMATGMTNAMFRLQVFSMEGVFAPNTRVWLFANNEVATTCEPGACQEFTTDVAGRATAPVMVPAGGWYAYRVHAHMGTSGGSTFLDSIQRNELAPTTGGELLGSAVAQSTADLIPAILGYQRAPGRTTLAGRVLDCDGNTVRGAVIRVFAGSTEIEETTTGIFDPHYIFFRQSTGSAQPPAGHCIHQQRRPLRSHQCTRRPGRADRGLGKAQRRNGASAPWL